MNVLATHAGKHDRRREKMAKKSGSNILVLALLGILILSTIQPQTVTQPTTTPTGVATPVPVTDAASQEAAIIKSLCGDSIQNTNVQYMLDNKYVKGVMTTESITGTVYMYNKAAYLAGASHFSTASALTGNAWSTAVAVPCGTDLVSVVFGSNNTVTGQVMMSGRVGRMAQTLTFDNVGIPEYRLQAQAYSSSWSPLFNSTSTGGTLQWRFSNGGTTAVDLFTTITADAIASSDEAWAAGDDKTYRLYVKSGNSSINRKFGGAIETGLTLEYTTDVTNTPDVTVVGAVVSAIPTDSVISARVTRAGAVMQSYALYDATSYVTSGGITMVPFKFGTSNVEIDVHFAFNAGSTVDTNDDVVTIFSAKDYYSSTKNTGLVLTGYGKDDSAKTLLHSLAMFSLNGS